MPRTTQDIDLVLELVPGSLRRLLQDLGDEEYYVSEAAAVDAVRRRSQFNVIDLETGWKADLIVRKERPFSVEEFGRRQQVEMLGATVWVVSAEDTVLSKLEWAQKGQSERQLRDVAGVVALKGDELDVAYVERWASKLGVTELWRQAQAMAADLGQ
jgi:hypothetical protein